LWLKGVVAGQPGLGIAALANSGGASMEMAATSRFWWWVQSSFAPSRIFSGAGVAPGAVGVLDPKADGGDRARHLANTWLAVTSTVRGLPSAVGSEIRKPVPTVRRAVGQRLLDLNSGLDQIDGQATAIEPLRTLRFESNERCAAPFDQNLTPHKLPSCRTMRGRHERPRSDGWSRASWR
jgi:hypothetical protein